MKRGIFVISLFISLLLLIGCCNLAKNNNKTPANVGFEVSGHLDNLANSTVYLMKAGDYLGYTFEPIDTTKVVDGEFSFSGKVDFPEMYYLTTENNESFSFFIENSKIHIEGNINELDSVEINGSTHQDRLVGIQKHLDSLDNEEEKLEYINKVIHDDNESAIAPYLILVHIFNLATYEELMSFYSQLSPELNQHRYTRRIKNQLNILESVKVGKIAPDFVLKDTSGNNIKLSSFKGSFVLIDFWASWCAPCRKENPAMIELYDELKRQDIPFEIIGVAADFVEARWKKAIKKDQLPWINVSDVKGFDGIALKLFGIKSIPYTVLLDKDGKIVMKGLTGEELRIKLGETIMAQLPPTLH